MKVIDDAEVPKDGRIDTSREARAVAAEIEAFFAAELGREKPPLREEDKIRLGPDHSAEIMEEASNYPPESFDRLRCVWQAAIENRAWYHRLKGKSDEEARQLATDETRRDFNRTDDFRNVKRG